MKTITIDIDRDYSDVLAIAFIGRNFGITNIYNTALDLTGDARHFSLRHTENGKMIVKKYDSDGNEVDE